MGIRYNADVRVENSNSSLKGGRSQLIINVPKHYDMLKSVYSWIYPDVQPVPETTEGRSLLRVLTINGISINLRINQQEIGHGLEVKYTPNVSDQDMLKRKIKFILGLEVDTSEAIAVMGKKSELREISMRVRGIRPYTADTPFEALIKSIIQQQISYRAANILTKRLILANSRADAIYHKFPSASMLVRMKEGGLRDIGLGYKANYILNVCEKVESEELQLESLIGKSMREIKDELIPIKGIGEWTIQVLAIAGLGNFSIFPFGDLGVQNTITRILGLSKRISKDELRGYSQEMGDQGPLVLYLVMCADVLDIIGTTNI